MKMERLLFNKILTKSNSFRYLVEDKNKSNIIFYNKNGFDAETSRQTTTTQTSQKDKRCYV